MEWCVKTKIILQILWLDHAVVGIGRDQFLSTYRTKVRAPKMLLLRQR